LTDHKLAARSRLELIIMAIGSESSVQALELEQYAKNISSVIANSGTLYGIFDSEIEQEDIANQTQAGSDVRPSWRVGLRVQAGQAVQQTNANGGNMGSGNFSVYNDFNLSPTYLSSVEQHSRLAAAATNSKDRAVLDAIAKERVNGLESTINGIEGLLFGDGSGSLRQIPSTAQISSGSGTGNNTSFISGINALVFTDNMVIQVFPSEGGNSRGTATVSTSDGATGTVFFSTALPAGTTQGDFLVINGASGAVGSSILGTTAWVNSASTGMLAGLNRANFPSRISSPSINKAGGSLVASDSQKFAALMQRVVGTKGDEVVNQVMVITTGIAANIAESTWYNRAITNAVEGGSGVPDVAKKGSVQKFGGRRLIVANAQPEGRIDVLSLKDWKKGNLIQLQPYMYAPGMTVFPVIATDGSGQITTAFQSALETSFAIATGAPRRQLFVENVAETDLNS
jgi:hypothetical protein